MPIIKKHSSVRGRPTSNENRNVPRDITIAAEQCLEHKSPHQITISEVANLANTRPSMINYYFGGLEGLLEEIVRQGLKEILEETKSLHIAIINNEVNDPLRALIMAFADSYNQRPALMRTLLSETLRDNSSIGNFFLKDWPSYGKQMMEEVLLHLSKQGYYRSDINIEGISSMIRSVIYFPLVIKPYLGREGKVIQNYLDSEWVDFITEVFECYLLPKE